MPEPHPLHPQLQKSIDETKVDYVKLGPSGLSVSIPILGGMSFGPKQWADWVLDEKESIEILKAAYDRGINTWDTANAFSNGQSELVIIKAIKQHNIPREKVTIMTKCYLVVGEETNLHVVDHVPDQGRDYMNQGGK